MPVLGFLFCFGIWVGLATPAKIAGGIWFVLGVIHLAYLTRGLRREPVLLDFSES